MKWILCMILFFDWMIWFINLKLLKSVLSFVITNYFSDNIFVFFMRSWRAHGTSFKVFVVCVLSTYQTVFLCVSFYNSHESMGIVLILKIGVWKFGIIHHLWSRHETLINWKLVVYKTACMIYHAVTFEYADNFFFNDRQLICQLFIYWRAAIYQQITDVL